ncbi:MAG: diaminopimelate epimerase [Defluviitaleaceae bacterium]|nr:diaminopimelate epimerase [Defluviitaleaceae bacterium]
MKFTKMHGIGNDYIYFDCTKDDIKNPEALAIKLSDRRCGVGSDGIILVRPSKIADFRMSMFNADGSEARMCGNGIRCVGKFVYDKALTDKTYVEIETLGGIQKLDLNVVNGKVQTVKVNVGKVVLEGSKIPTTLDMARIINHPLTVLGEQYRINCILIGNHHCVVYVDDLETLDLEKIGPAFEHHEIFPDRINTEFVKIIDNKVFEMRVWERGSGETWACGTGACAVAVAGVLNGHAPYNERIKVKLKGGDLFIIYMEDGTVYMEGAAQTVFEGWVEGNIVK